MHSEAPEKIKELTDKAVVLKDNEIYEVKEQTNNMEEPKLITYAEIEERLKNVPLEQMSAQDVFDKFIRTTETMTTITI